jgi:hypothetical protein
MGELGPKGIYDYVSDDTNTYSKLMRSALATAGGFSASSAVAANYPTKWRMRHVWARAADGTKKKIPISTAADAHYTTGGSITVGATSYVIMGREGEKMNISLYHT